MAVVRHKDGRWYVAGRKGFFPDDPNRTKQYFGRDKESEMAARELDRHLLAHRPAKGGEIGNIIKIKDLIIDQAVEKIREEFFSQKRKGNNARVSITEKEVVKELLYKIAVSKPEHPVKVNVKTEHGIIDVICGDEIIEVKCIENWKQAIGQISAYHACMPDYRKRLHLFGAKNDASKRLARKIQTQCRHKKIRLTLYLI